MRASLVVLATLLAASPAWARRPRISRNVEQVAVENWSNSESGDHLVKVRLTPARPKDPPRLRTVRLKPGVWTPIASGADVEFLLHSDHRGVRRQVRHLVRSPRVFKGAYALENLSAKLEDTGLTVEGMLLATTGRRLTFPATILEHARIEGDNILSLETRGTAFIVREVLDASRSLDGGKVRTLAMRFAATGLAAGQALPLASLMDDELELHFDGAQLKAFGVIER